MGDGFSPTSFCCGITRFERYNKGHERCSRNGLTDSARQKRVDGWHSQYDGFEQTHQFLHHPSTLNRFVPSEMYVTYLIELLSGIGIVRPRRNFDDDADAGTGSRNPPKKMALDAAFLANSAIGGRKE